MSKSNKSVSIFSSIETVGLGKKLKGVEMPVDFAVDFKGKRKSK